jgi:hypothetical protein
MVAPGVPILENEDPTLELYSPSGRREDIVEEIFDPLPPPWLHGRVALGNATRSGYGYGFDIQEQIPRLDYPQMPRSIYENINEEVINDYKSLRIPELE